MLNALFISYILILAGTIFTKGFYSYPGIIILLSSFLILVKYFNHKPSNKKYNLILPRVILLISVVFTLLLYGGMYQRNILNIFQISQILLSASLLLSLTYIIYPSEVHRLIVKYRFKLLVALIILVEILMIVSSPNPGIDVYRSIKYGVKEFIAFGNPYQGIYPQVYEGKILDYFAYFPTILFYFLPFTLLLFDPRFGIIFAQFVVSLVMYTLFKKKKYSISDSEMLALIPLYYPLIPFITEQSFTDAVMVMAASIILYILYTPPLDKNRKLIIGVAIFTMNIKQVLFGFIPIFLFKTGIVRTFKDFFALYFLGALILLPFIAWSYQDFLYDTVLIYLSPPQGTNYNAALTIRALIADIAKFEINPNVLFSLTLVYILMLYKKIGKGKSEFFKYMSYFFFGFFLMGGFAYLNHYYLVGNLLLLYIYSLLLNSNNSGPRKPAEV